MNTLDAMLSTVDAELLVVMGVSFVAVVWWGFRKTRNGDGLGGSDAVGGQWFGGDDAGDAGDGGDGGD